MIASFLFAVGLLACGGPAAPAPTGSTGTAPDTTQPTGDTAPAATLDMVAVSSEEEEAESPWLVAGDAPGQWYAAFVRRDAEGYHRTWVAVSDDDGATWSAPAAVSEPGDDVQSRWPDGPSLAVGADRLVVGYVTAERSGYATKVVQLDRSFGSQQELLHLPMPAEYHSMTYATVALDRDGQALVAVVAAPFLDGRLWVARERHGWAVEDVSATSPLELPCECCPPAVHVRADGQLVVAWRGDIAKEIYLASGPPEGPFDAFEQATASGVRGELCPLDGPQLVGDGDDVAIAWSDASTTGPRLWWSEREGDGWRHTEVAPSDGTDPSRPSVAGAPEARRFVWEIGTFQPYRWGTLDEVRGQALDGPGGRLYEVRMATGDDGRAYGLGVDEGGALWFVRFP